MYNVKHSLQIYFKKYFALLFTFTIIDVRKIGKMVKDESIESHIVHDMHAAVEAPLRKLLTFSLEN